MPQRSWPWNRKSTLSRQDTEKQNSPQRHDTEETKRPESSSLTGFAQVANVTVQEPEKSWIIFRTYDELAVRHLLYLETRIAVLAKKQRQFDEEDGREDATDIALAAQDWEYFQSRAQDDKFASEPERWELEERWKIADQLGTALRKYHKALCLYNQVLNLPRPDKHALDAYKSLGEGKHGQTGVLHHMLSGEAEKRLDDTNALCALKESENNDFLSRLLQHYFTLPFTKKVVAGDVVITSAGRLHVFVSCLVATAAFGLLFGAIEALYRQNDHGKRLGILAGFVAGFAIVVSLFTQAKRGEIFAATAAYTAVLVVYVSESNNKKGTGA